MTISNIVTETVDPIFVVLNDPFLKTPSSENDWKSISERFEEVSSLPHAVRAMNGKHICIEYPKLSDTLYHSYKGVYSMVLLAVCDVDYCFTMYDFGSYGSNNDSGVLANSTIRTRLKST